VQARAVNIDDVYRGFWAVDFLVFRSARYLHQPR
jgi:hypothetical protein